MASLSSILVSCYLLSSILLIVYGYNCYYLIYLFFKHKKRESSQHKQFIKTFYQQQSERPLPKVTTQLPVFNERFVIKRLIRAVTAIDYPKDRHTIQVLDDSTDETVEITKNMISEYDQKGFDIRYVRRPKRIHFKAGALQYGLENSDSAFFAIFDSDFMPPVDFYKQTIPYFLENEKIGTLQTRWGHLNSNRSWLTKAQAIGIDGHFAIEQAARSGGGLFINFNGTAGVWRREAITQAGGWQGDTLTEDMDLSYRSQLVGWKTKFLYDVVCKAEIPENMNAFKSQQFRWAKGSIQTAKKLLPSIWKSSFSWKHKFQGTLHLTHYMIHPAMLLMSFTALPILFFVDVHISGKLFVLLLTILLGAFIAPPFMYTISQWIQKENWLKKLKGMPMLMTIGMGIAVNNTHAVLSALFGSKGAFIRTPKSGVTSNASSQVGTTCYKVKLKSTYFIELILAGYCFYTFLIYIQEQKYLIGPFSLIYALGFFLASFFSLQHYFLKQSKS